MLNNSIINRCLVNGINLNCFSNNSITMRNFRDMFTQVQLNKKIDDTLPLKIDF